MMNTTNIAYAEPCVFFISHADVVIDPDQPIPKWPLSEKGIQRHREFNLNEFIHAITSIYCSTEQKAIDGAEILASAIHLPTQKLEALGENDRSATGYLPSQEFQATANLFFANPTISIRGWERAIDAQTRIVDSIDAILQNDLTTGHIGIVSHGGVGTLLLCHLLQQPISRNHDQPPTSNGGNYFAFSRSNKKIIHSWINISAK